MSSAMPRGPARIGAALAHAVSRRLSAGIVLVVGAGLLLPALIGAALIGALRESQLDEAMQKQLSGQVELLAGNLATPLWNFDLGTVRTISEALFADPQVVRVTLRDGDQQLLLDIGHPERRIGMARVARRDLVAHGNRIGAVEIEVDDGLWQRAHASDRRASFVVLFFQFVLTLALILLALRSRVLAPLARLSAFSDRLASGDLECRLDWQRADEIGRLARQLEQMRASLRTLFAEQRAVLDNVPVGVLFVRENTIVLANRQAAQLFGYAPDALLGIRIDTLGLTRSDDLASDGCIDDRELSLCRRDGTAFWVRLRVSALDPVGDLTGSLWAVTDITERKLAALHLEESRSLLKTLMHALPDLVWMKNEDGVYLACNQRFERFFGASEEEIVGRTDRDFVSRELADFFRHHDQLAIEKSESCRNEESVTFADDGHQELLETTKTPIYDAGHRLLGVLGIGHDITQRKRDEIALRESEQRYRVVFQTNLDLIAVHRLDDGVFVDVNQAYLDALGYSYREIVGHSSLELDIWAGPFSRQDFIDALRSAAKIVNIETRLRKKNGELIWGLISASLIELDAVSCVHSVIHDITAHKAIESELAEHRQHLERLVALRTADLDTANRALTVARDAAEAASRAKSAFLANMSHEIRTPMNAIVGLAHILRRGDVSPRQAELLDKIDSASTHLLATINAVLDLSKIEAGKFVVEVAPVSVADVLGNVHAIVDERARAKGLALGVDCAVFPDGLLGDAMRLQQALLNYATNAVKFTESGTITLRARVDDETAETLLVRFEVEDSGVGIAPEALPRLFAAFEQVDNSTTRRYGGSGLGLAITRRLAELMGGSAGARSTPGVGSVFWFTACLAKPHAVAAAPAARGVTAERMLRAKHGGARVLLVDDEPVNLAIARLLLEDVGLAVDTASDGLAAVERAGVTRYALILMDMQMPRLDGLDATRRIRALPGYAATPIVAMTANAFAEDRTRCLAAGMNDFLTKPFDPDQLFERLLGWLQTGARNNG